MTLQHRRRNQWEDQTWRERIRLSNAFLTEVVDWWCRSDEDFPIDDVIAGILFLFSPRCYPLGMSDFELLEQVCEVVDSPSDEYSKTWPKRGDDQRTEMVEALSQILVEAVKNWNSGSLADPTIEGVNRLIVEQIIVRQYVVFHHYQTTKRDLGGFFSGG